uniref:dolichyl-phosphate-mannose--protein mannosyltransferase n=1 Tax=Sinocyclocheilus rhinocerous TaxID=307959 RepID=A0A673JVN6_9TELE
MTANSRGTKAASPPVQRRLSALPRPGAGVRLLRYAALVAVCALCYSNSLWGEFVHDDIWAITNNPDVRPGSSLRSIFTNDFWGKRMADNTSHKSYRPLCILTFNVLKHNRNMILYCIVCVDTLCNYIHHGFEICHTCVLQVSGIVGRADVLASMLFLLAFLSYIRMADEFPPTVSVLSLALSLLLGTCAMLVKETGVTVFGVCVLYDFLLPFPGVQYALKSTDEHTHTHTHTHTVIKPSSLQLCTESISKIAMYCLSSTPPPPPSLASFLSFISPTFPDTAVMVSCHVTVIMSFRLWLMGGSMPLFSEQDNPASFSLYLLTRFLTYCYLLAFNAWLLLAPIVLCYDWQVGSIPLVESLWDGRNIASLTLALVMLALSLNCVTCLQKMKGKEVLVGLLFLIFPFIPASNLFFRVGFVVAERVLYMPSMGYCVLVVHGLNRLNSVVSRWGAAALTVSMLVVLLLFSWKTVQQNEIWLSREALFRSGIQTLPHNAKVHYNYANFLKDRGRNQEAIYHYKTSNLTLNGFSAKGIISNFLKFQYTLIPQLYPRHASALNNLGTLTHQTEEAERMLKESIHFGPHFADAYSSLASLYADQGHSKEANEIYTKGIENCPDSSDLHNNYGVFLVDTGHGDRAAFHYQEAVRLKPSHYVAMVNLGRLLRSSNDNKEAELWYKRALQVVRKVDILTPLGALYYNTGRYEEALEVYREAATLQPDSTDIWLALVQVLAMAGRSAEAEKMTLGIISKTSNCIECYRLLSAIYSKQGNHTEALDALKTALQQEPSDPAVKAELHFSMGNQLREMNELDRAFQSYKLAVELKPDQSQAWMNMGGIQHIKGDYAAARMYYQRALLLSPGSKLLKENLAKLDRLEKKLQGA